MASYLRCLKSHRGSNDPECRNLSKSYLSCRMDRYVLLIFRLHPPAPASATRCLSEARDSDRPVIPSCQSGCDQVLGTLDGGGSARCKGEKLYRSFRRSCQDLKRSAALHLPQLSEGSICFLLRRCIIRRLLLHPPPHISAPPPHFLPSHYLGSSRADYRRPK
jgi:hypothetical protein